MARAAHANALAAAATQLIKCEVLLCNVSQAYKQQMVLITWC